MGTGIGVLVKTSASYLDPIANAATVLASASSAFSYTSGAPLSVTGSLANPSTGAFGDYVQLQMSVASTASPGTTGSEQLIFSYDES